MRSGSCRVGCDVVVASLVVCAGFNVSVDVGTPVPVGAGIDSASEDGDVVTDCGAVRRDSGSR